MSSAGDKIKGMANEAVGNVKQAVGKATGNDRLRADPQVDYSPAGVEHIEDETKQFVQRCFDKAGKESGTKRQETLTKLATELDGAAAGAGDPAKVRTLAATVRAMAAKT